MNDGKFIIENILNDAKKESEAIIEDAENKATSIIEKNNKEIEYIRKKAEEKIKENNEMISLKEISSAKMSARRMILSKKQQLIDETISDAYEKLASLDEDKYFGIIKKMLENAVPEGEIILSDEDKRVIGRLLKAEGYNVSDETRKIDRGFVVKYGDAENNFVFSSILDVYKEEIRMIVSKILFA